MIRLSPPIFVATVGAVDPEGVTLIMPGDTQPSKKHYKYNTSAQMVAGNRVLCLRIAGTCVAVCPINGAWTPPSGGGTVYVPSLTPLSPASLGNRLSWTNNGDLDNPPPVDILNGKDGTPGKDGTDGKTPLKGKDYWTAADQEQIVKDTIEMMPPELKLPVITADDEGAFLQAQGGYAHWVQLVDRGDVGA